MTNRRIVRVAGICALLLAMAGPAAAQQSFSFIVATDDQEPPPGGSAPATARLFAGRQLEPLGGAQVSTGRLTVVGMEDVRFDRRDTRQVRQVEILAELWRGARGAKVAAGTGVRRESSGTNVLLSRAVVESSLLAGRVIGNVLLERPLSGERDALDVITTVGYSRRVTPRLLVGAEALLQDVEGFWDPAEADGGARLFVGPSVDFVPSTSWNLHLTAGRDMRASDSVNAGDAFRALGRSGLVMRLSATYRF